MEQTNHQGHACEIAKIKETYLSGLEYDSSHKLLQQHYDLSEPQ
jgi:hypothetical protein